jgi:hypothetical protein
MTSISTLPALRTVSDALTLSNQQLYRVLPSSLDSQSLTNAKTIPSDDNLFSRKVARLFHPSNVLQFQSALAKDQQAMAATVLKLLSVVNLQQQALNSIVKFGQVSDTAPPPEGNQAATLENLSLNTVV